MNTPNQYHIISLRFLQTQIGLNALIRIPEKNILSEYPEYIIKFKEKHVVIILYHL